MGINGGKVCRVLENLNELKNVPNDVKYELFQSTLGLMDLCNRAYLKANKDKASFVEQKKAAGMYNEWFEKLMEDFVINKFHIPTLKGFAIKMFDSPWAKTTENELRSESEYYSLMRLIDELHICRDIHFFRRIHNPGIELEFLYLQPANSFF